jgi:hypothetical protein
VARYLSDLSKYDFALIHKPGKTNHADHLSRHPGYDTGIHDNEEVLVLPDKLFANALHLGGLEAEIADQQQGRTEIRDWETTWPIKEKEGVFYHHGWMVVPQNSELQKQLLQQYHDHIMAGHPGIKNMLHALAQDFWWPTMKAFIMGYIKGCTVCQSTKPNTVHAKIPLLPITSERGALPFQVVAMDLITDLPESQGKDTILTIVDHDCSKAAIFVPCMKTIMAEGLASLYAQLVLPQLDNSAQPRLGLT